MWCVFLFFLFTLFAAVTSIQYFALLLDCHATFCFDFLYSCLVSEPVSRKTNTRRQPQQQQQQQQQEIYSRKKKQMKKTIPTVVCLLFSHKPNTVASRLQPLGIGLCHFVSAPTSPFEQRTVVKPQAFFGKNYDELVQGFNFPYLTLMETNLTSKTP